MRNETQLLPTQTPFVPFVFGMNSGDRYEVRYPGPVQMGKDVIFSMRPHSDRRDVLRFTEISSIEVLDPA